MRYMSFFISFSFLFLISCTPAQRGATAKGFVVTGPSSASVGVNKPLRLLSSGRQISSVKGDNSQFVTTTNTFGIYAVDRKGRIDRYVHIISSTLPNNQWRFAKESYGKPTGIDYSKTDVGHKFSTFQTYLLTSKGDWFSEFWKKNKRSVSTYWIARRWSTLLDKGSKLIVEYREPLPQCLLKNDDLLQKAIKSLATGRKFVPEDKQAIWGRCGKEISSFNKRADASFSFGVDQPALPIEISPTRLISFPSSKINVPALIGDIEFIEKDAPEFLN